MIYIHHRINTIEQLQKVPVQDGIELDVRYHKNALILSHDPFHHHEQNPEHLENLLKHWKHQGPMILNIKSSGIETECIRLMRKYHIYDWFFLDLSMPDFVHFALKAKQGNIPGFSNKNLAVRFSEYEVIEYALSFADNVEWIWVDCFSTFPLNKDNYKIIQNNDLKICCVSPELQQHSIDNIQDYKTQMQQFDIAAICTKYPDLWK